MRGYFSIVAAASALLAASPAAADRLIDACQVAVNVHAKSVQLAFPTATRTGQSVDLAIQFVSDGDAYQGKATCVFRETSEAEPPSLSSIEAMGKTNAGMYLMSHHAVWQHFTGSRQEAAMPVRFQKEPEKERPRRRPVFASM